MQCLFDAGVVAPIAVLGRGGFWNWRGAQPPNVYPVPVAGAVLKAATLLMLWVAKPNYISLVVPLLGVLMIEKWWRTGEVVVTRAMIAWPAFAWFSVISLELRWNWLVRAAPTTWALLLLGAKSLCLIGELSANGEAKQGRGSDNRLLASVPGEAAVESLRATRASLDDGWDHASRSPRSAKFRAMIMPMQG